MSVHISNKAKSGKIQRWVPDQHQALSDGRAQLPGHRIAGPEITSHLHKVVRWDTANEMNDEHHHPCRSQFSIATF